MLAETYVTHKLAQLLQLPTKNHRDVDTHVFASEERTKLRIEVYFQLIAENGFQLDLSADTTRLISRNLKTIDMNKFKILYPKYDSYQFADLANDEEIDVMIRNDYLFHFLLPQEKEQVTNDLFLIKSVLG